MMMVMNSTMENDLMKNDEVPFDTKEDVEVKEEHVIKEEHVNLFVK